MCALTIRGIDARRTLLTAALILTAPGTAAGQDTRGPLAITGGISRVTTMAMDEDGLIVADLRISRIRPQRAGGDFTLSIIPVALQYGVLAGAIEGGPVLTLGGVDARLLLRPGLGLLGAVGGGGAGVLPEAYAGAAVLLGRPGSGILRFDASVHAMPFGALLRMGAGFGGFAGSRK